MKTILDNYRKILFSLGRFYTLLQMLCQPCRSQRDVFFRIVWLFVPDSKLAAKTPMMDGSRADDDLSLAV